MWWNFFQSSWGFPQSSLNQFVFFKVPRFSQQISREFPWVSQRSSFEKPHSLEPLIKIYPDFPKWEISGTVLKAFFPVTFHVQLRTKEKGRKWLKMKWGRRMQLHGSPFSSQQSPGKLMHFPLAFSSLTLFFLFLVIFSSLILPWNAHLSEHHCIKAPWSLSWKLMTGKHKSLESILVNERNYWKFNWNWLNENF